MFGKALRTVTKVYSLLALVKGMGMEGDTGKVINSFFKYVSIVSLFKVHI